MSLFQHYQSRFDHSRPEEYTLEQYLNICKMIQLLMRRLLNVC